MSAPFYDPPIRRAGLDPDAAIHLTRYLADAFGTMLGSNDVTSWSFKVYDRMSTSEDVALYSSGTLPPSQKNEDGSPIILAAAVVNGVSPDTRGHTFDFLFSLGSIEGDVRGGGWYRVDFTLQVANGVVAFGADLGYAARMP